MKVNLWFKKKFTNQSYCSSAILETYPSQSLTSSSKFLQRLKLKFQRSFSSLVSAEKLIQFECVEQLEQIRLEIQENFDKQVDEILKKFLDNHFKSTITESRCRLGASALPTDINKRICYCLLKNSQGRYKHTRSSVNNTSPAVKRGEVMLRDFRGKYRKLFEGFDESKPYKRFNQVDSRCKIFWNIDSITNQTKFVFDFEINQMFGFGKKHKCRSVGHLPHLMRYLIDSQDRRWLRQQQILIEEKPSARIKIFVLDQILELPEKFAIYRRQYNHLDFNKLKSFTLPQFILRKIRLFFIHLQIKSDGFITTVAPVKRGRESNALGGEICNGSESLQSTVNSTTLPFGSRQNSTVTPVYDSDMESSCSMVSTSYFNKPIACPYQP